MKKSILTLLTIFCFANCFAQNDCDKLKHCKLKSLDTAGKNSVIAINGDEFIESTEDGKYHINAKLVWKEDCVYETTIVSTNIPNFSFKPGDSMKVKIKKIENSKVYMTAIVQNNNFELEYQLIE